MPVAPAPAESAPTDLLALDPVSLDPALTDPALTDPVLTDPVPVAGGVLSVGPLPVPPPAGGLDGGNTAVGELLAAPDARGVARALADMDGWVALVEQPAPVAPAVCWPLFALVLDFAEAVLLVSPVAVEVAFAVAVAVAVPVPVGVAVPVAVTVGVAVAVSPALLLVPPLSGLLTELAGGAVGFANLADVAGLAGADDGDTVKHGVAGALFWTAEVPPPPAPPAGAFWVADPFPFRLGVPSELGPEIPTAEPRLTKAWRSGGTDRATPMANTAQAAAIAGRSHPYRQPRCCRSPAPSASWPPRAAFHRRTMPARKPARAAACLLA